MAIIVVRATYTEQTALEKYFTELFGWGRSSVLVGGTRVKFASRRWLMPLLSGSVDDSNVLSPDS